MGQIKVEGLAYPIQTYEILDEASAEERLGAAEGSDMSLGIDLCQLEPEQLEAARKALHQALAEGSESAP